MTTLRNFSPEQQHGAQNDLRVVAPKGATVYTVLRHVSRSGMQRRISLLLVEDGRIRDISFLAAKALNYAINREDGGVIINGCGMDMGFELVYNLSCVLHDDGYAIKHQWV
ncbi:MAG: hypothetical protein KGL63_11525 [Betaproteobacteria bacterium]|nr:hypothetical protein [Betaproteobacteria bacterium]